MWFLLKWLVKNLKIEKSNVVVQNQASPTHIIENSKLDNRDLGPIEVGVQKQIKIESADEQSVKMDEVKRGKVKTQKDKLKKLRG